MVLNKDMSSHQITNPTTFTLGGYASATSACDSDCIWVFEVVKLSKCFVTLRDIYTDETYRTKIQTSNWDGTEEESTKPFGTYSMCAIARPIAAPLAA